MNFFKMMFTWWHSQTLGTWLHTLLRGKAVGEDAQGNRYYEDKAGRSINGKPRRWVVYNGDIEASRVPPEWHGWLHYTVDTVPQAPAKQKWFKPHQINLTGTKDAHCPRGHDEPVRYPDGYDAWRPE